MTDDMRAPAKTSRNLAALSDFRRTLTAAVALLAPLLLAACGQSPGIALTVDSATAEVLRGSDVAIEVTLARTGGAAGDVALSITGLPANVTASFSPPILSGSTLTSVLTLAATAAAVDGSHDLTIAGTSAGMAATVAVTLDIASLTVEGRVASAFYGPIIGVKVGSQGVEATTDGTGAFSLAGLTVPYDLSIWNSAAEWVHIYEGLTTSQPLVAPPNATGNVFFITRSTTLMGNLTGGQIPVGTDQAVLVCIEGITIALFDCDYVLPGDSSYSMTINWKTYSELDVRVHALQIERDGGVGYPVAYPGYASADLTLISGTPATADFDLGTALATTEVAVELEAPLVVGGLVAGVEFGANLVMSAASITSNVTSHEVLMPLIDGVSYMFAAVVAGPQTGIGWASGITGSTATVALPNNLQSLSPPDTATGITPATNFTVSNPDGGPVTHIWSDPLGDLRIGLTTMSTSSTLPDLAPYGLVLPPSTDLTWRPVAHSGSSTEGASAGDHAYYAILGLALAGTGPAVSESGTYTMGEQREVTTAP